MGTRDEEPGTGDAQRRLAELEARYEEAQSALERTRGRLERVERQRRIDQILMEHGAVDLEAARVLTEHAVDRAEEKEPDLSGAVEELLRRRPYLFRSRSGADATSASAGGGAMAAKRRAGSEEGIDAAAEAASVSGNRRDLLRYLRIRRGRKW